NELRSESGSEAVEPSVPYYRRFPFCAAVEPPEEWPENFTRTDAAADAEQMFKKAKDDEGKRQKERIKRYTESASKQTEEQKKGRDRYLGEATLAGRVRALH